MKNRSKFVYNLSLIILFTITSINSLADQNLACQKLLSGGAAKMSKDEMIKNFMQCVGITDPKSMEIIQNKLNPAERNSNVDIIQKGALEFGRITSVVSLAGSITGILGSLFGLWKVDTGKFAAAGALGFVGTITFGILDSYHKAVRMKHEKE